MNIREASDKDFEAIWSIFEEIVSAGETYAYDQSTSKEEAHQMWLSLPEKTFVVEKTTNCLELTI
jgi:hypothetical protein